MFSDEKLNFLTDAKGSRSYYSYLLKRVRDKEVDLLIVVEIFLIVFDAPSLNTLFVDKNLRYHGLIQAFSRTNRIFNEVKSFGNIVCFRDLQKATEDALELLVTKIVSMLCLKKVMNSTWKGLRTKFLVIM